MKRIDTFYSKSYGANTSSLSMRKLPLIAEGIKERGLANLIEPKHVAEVADKLKDVHFKEYVESVLTGIGKSASSNGWKWTPQIRDGVLASNAGMLEAAERALDTGIAANVGQGYHHAEWFRGGGFCTFNALALVASQMPDKKVFVLDCDEHQGNGTKAFTRQFDNLYNFSIFGTYFGNADILPRAWDNEVAGWDAYENALYGAFTTIADINPDIILYQAGMDCVKGDGMDFARISAAEAKIRDEAVFDFAKGCDIPIAFCCAGGYGKKAARNHINTWQAAVNIYG